LRSKSGSLAAILHPSNRLAQANNVLAYASNVSGSEWVIIQLVMR